MSDEVHSANLRDRTIADFGEQWSRYTDNEGFYGSVELLADVLGPLLPLHELRGQRVAEIGSGTGRIVRMLLRAGAQHVVALEPSRAVEVLQRNLRHETHRVEILHARGEEIPAGLDLDVVLSIGVLHHVPEPHPVVRAAYRALRPGGRIVVWLYGKEGQRTVVAAIGIMRSITTRLPHALLAPIAWSCNLVLDVYIPLCRRLPSLPLADYMCNLLARFSRRKRFLVIYDQLKPAYAKYYDRSQARELLEGAGFVDVQLYHRRGYSWTVSGRRPDGQTPNPS